MTTTRIANSLAAIIDTFDAGAHRAISAWHDGGERLAQIAKQRWDRAFDESSPELSEETRRNASHAQEVFGSYYQRGLDLSTSGAAIAVDTLVQAARSGVERAVHHAREWQRAGA